MPEDNPTNADIVREVKVVSQQVADHGSRINNLEAWRIGSEAAKKAVDDYRTSEKPSGITINSELIRALLIALGVIVTLAGVIAATRGK